MEYSSKVHPRTSHEGLKVGGGADVFLYSSFNLGARWGGGQRQVPATLSLGKDAVPIV